MSPTLTDAGVAASDPSDGLAVLEARGSTELTSDEWKKVLSELAEIGVLQVHFSGGEPTARKDLVELVKHATTPAEREAVCNALIFKTNVLWVQLDALYHAYVDGHIPPGAFVPAAS